MILVAGAHGQLGRALMQRGADLKLPVTGMDLPQLDITDPERLAADFANVKPVVVVNAAAYTDVDGAETDPDSAFRVNAAGPANLAECCSAAGAVLIHISTDYVFDGNRRAPWKESDPIAPLGVYGRSKAEGEKRVREALAAHIILRTAWLYGIHGRNFVKTMLRLAGGSEPVRVVADQFGSPTCAEDLAAAIFDIIRYGKKEKHRRWGTYHYCNRGVVSWHGFAEEIFRRYKQLTGKPSAELEAIPTAEYPTAARRPAYSALDCSRIAAAFGISPPRWQESLEKTIEALLRKTHSEHQ
jgi:dTDP-4-dehydrorhamnose reductase